MEAEPCRHRHTIQILQLIVVFARQATPILIGPQNIAMVASMSGRQAVATDPRIRCSAALRGEASTDWVQPVPGKRCESERRFWPRPVDCCIRGGMTVRAPVMALLSLCLAASGLADSMPDLASVSVGSQANGSPPAMMIDLIAQGTP